jgi:hypothetical protein
VLAAAFVLYFGVARPLIDREAAYPFQALLVPCLGLVLLSLDRVFNTLRILLPIPPFTSERVAARMVSLAFVFILIGACVLFQRWLDKNRPNLARLLAMLLLLVLGAYDLFINIRIWSVRNVAPFDPSRYFPANQYKDTPYLALLAIGLLVSAASAAGLLYLAWRERRN